MEENRPDFRDIKSFEEFNRYYWYREELSQICKYLGLEYRCVNDTLRMYKNDDIRMYNFDCITDTIVEVITTC
ncbi:MAG: hypothetical protein E6422_09925, partial [Veillonella sp.]|nr:hypothetical protein [Veillonella sp.]